MPIELAQHNKRGLSLTSPLLAGSGAVGFGDAFPPGLGFAAFGAIVTTAVSIRPRSGAPPPRYAELPAGFLFHTGDHNPGFQRTIRSHAPTWCRAPCPILLALAGGDAGDRVWMARRLEEEDLGIAGIELTVAEDDNLGEASAFISAVRHATTLPLLVKLPATRAAHLAQTCVVAGADALVIGAAPPALYPAAGGELLEAPLAGPIALPFTLRALRHVAALDLDAPLIASGGIHSLADVDLCFDLGANAVQIRSLVWVDPAAAQQLAQELAQRTEDEHAA